jgi:FixJ family two-component response regulator
MGEKGEANALQPWVYVVDDDPEVRRSTQWLLENSGFAVATYAAAEPFEADFLPDHPGCVILDIRMPRKDGLTLFEEMSEHGCDVPVIFLTGHGSVPQAVRAMRGGAYHFLEKPFDPRALIETVQTALEEDIELREKRRQRTQAAQRFAQLTERQQEVARYLAAGHTAKEAARRLELSPKTVEVHRGHILEKMAAATTVELVHLLRQADIQFPEN